MLITDAYKAEQEALHATGSYGTASLKFGGLVSQLVDTLEIDTLLDYGCGSKRSLLTVLNPERTVEYLRDTIGEEAWVAGMNPEIPEQSVMDNPYQYTDYASDFAIWKQ